MFQRESVRDLQQERLKDYLDKLEQDILGGGTTSTQAAEIADKDQAALFQQNLTAKKQLLEKLRKAQPTGRMVIDL